MLSECIPQIIAVEQRLQRIDRLVTIVGGVCHHAGAEDLLRHEATLHVEALADAVRVRDVVEHYGVLW